MLTVNQFFTAAQVVARSDLLTVLPERFLPLTGLEDRLVVASCRSSPARCTPTRSGMCATTARRRQWLLAQFAEVSAAAGASLTRAPIRAMLRQVVSATLSNHSFGSAAMNSPADQNRVARRRAGCPQGGIGRAARDWASFDRILECLKELGDDESLLIQSGKPVGVFKTHADAPRVLLANSTSFRSGPPGNTSTSSIARACSCTAR